MDFMAGNAVGYIDESIRGNTYVMGLVLVSSPADSRHQLRALAKSFKKRSLHFHELFPVRRQAAFDLFEQLPVDRSFVFSRKRPVGEREIDTRAVVLSAIVNRMQADGVGSIVLDSITDATERDGDTIRTARTGGPNLNYRHQYFTDEPLLWLADGIAYNHGANPMLAMPSWHQGTITA